MRIKYIYKKESDIKEFIFNIEDIENFDMCIEELQEHFVTFKDFDKYMIRLGYKLIDRCLSTEMFTKDEQEIFQGDIFLYEIYDYELGSSKKKLISSHQMEVKYIDDRFKLIGNNITDCLYNARRSAKYLGSKYNVCI